MFVQSSVYLISRQYILILLLFTCQKSAGQSFFNSFRNNLSIKAGAETRKEDFRWSIAGNKEGKDPNIYSELIFNPVRAAGYYVHADYRFFNRMSVRASYKHMYTYKGSVTDFDYDGDNRTIPATQLYLNSNKGNMRALNGNVYYDLLNIPLFLIKTGIGYSTTKELFYLLDNNDPDLQSTYTARWQGPSILAGIQWNTKRKIHLGTQASFNLLKYSAEANWNLIEEFRHPLSFTQSADGTGWDFNANAGYKLTKHTTIDLEWLYSNWKTGYGLDKLYLTNGESPETRMNGAFKKNSGWRLSATYTF